MSLLDETTLLPPTWHPRHNTQSLNMTQHYYALTSITSINNKMDAVLCIFYGNNIMLIPQEYNIPHEL